ncbi:hypothetical protein D3C87_1883460 [compost metagenome]
MAPVDRPQLTIFVAQCFALGNGVVIPDGLLGPVITELFAVQQGTQVVDVSGTREEPQQLAEYRLERHSLGGADGETLRQVETHLVSEDRTSTGAGTVAFLLAICEQTLK